MLRFADLTCSITSVLITRFLSDLQLVNRRAVLALDSDNSSHTDVAVGPSTLRFGTFIDSLGSTISSEDSEDSDAIVQKQEKRKAKAGVDAKEKERRAG